MTAPHAITRALERYGLKLTHGDLVDLCEECQKGYGRLSCLPDGMERHILLCRGKALVAIYAPYDGGRVRDKRGKIITILPPDAAYSGSATSPATRANMQRARPRGKPPKKSRQQRGW